MLRKAGVPELLINRFLTERDLATGSKRSKRDATAVVLDELAKAEMLQQALPSYRLTQPRLATEVTDFHAVPEIAAAVQSFVMSREAVPGIYVYFDVGGGTVDGVVFNYLNSPGGNAASTSIPARSSPLVSSRLERPSRKEPPPKSML